MLNIFNNTLKINIVNSEIKKCHRIVSKTTRDKPPAVLVRFSTDTAKVSVLRNRKFLKGGELQIKEDLTKMRLFLLDRAIRKFTYKDSWVLNGNIYVRFNKTVHRIYDESDLDKLK